LTEIISALTLSPFTNRNGEASKVAKLIEQVRLDTIVESVSSHKTDSYVNIVDPCYYINIWYDVIGDPFVTGVDHEIIT